MEMDVSRRDRLRRSAPSATSAVTSDVYDHLTSVTRRFNAGVLLDRFDLVFMAIVAVAGVLAIHDSAARAWPWAAVAAAAVMLFLYESNVSSHSPHEQIRATTDAVDAIYEDAHDKSIGLYPDDEVKLIPDLYGVGKLKNAHRWIRGDPTLVSALKALRPFNQHDGHRVRMVLSLLGEFYRRYARLLNRPLSVNIRHEYTIMYDIHLRVLNTIHELYFTKPIILCADLEVVTREVQARTYRMLRVLRHKYPDALRAVDVEKGTAPRSFDHSWTAHDLYV